MAFKTIFNHWFYLGLGLSLGLVLGIRLVNWPPLVVAQGGDNTFTYQGWLRQTDVAPAGLNANCDFEFELYDAPVSGNPVGSPTPNARTLTLTKGYFTTDLDFGDVFSTGQSRYLQVAVKCQPDTAFTTMDQRVAIHARPYARTAPWAGVTNKPVINTYTAGYGLNESTTNAETTLSVDPTIVQTAVSTGCSPGQKLLGINSNGTVNCATDQDTGFSAGDGLELITTTNTFNIDFTEVQKRVTGCTPGRIISEIRQDGTTDCKQFVREIVAGDGLGRTITLSGTTTSVRLDILQGGITTTMLAPNAVTSNKIEDGEVKSVDIGEGEVTTSHISNTTLLFEDFAGAANGCAANEVLQYGGSTIGWQCADPNPYTIGEGLQEVNRVLSVKVDDFAGTGLEGDSDTPDESMQVKLGSSGTFTFVARSNHNHNADYDTTIGHFEGHGDLDADNEVNRYFFPSSSFTLGQSSDCLVIADMNIYNTVGGHSNSSGDKSFLRTARTSPSAFDTAGTSAEFYFWNSSRTPAVSVNYPWSSVSAGSHKFGCYLDIDHKSINDDESYICRVSYLCQK